MKSEVDWLYLYSKAIRENKELKRQVQVLETILRTHLPVVEANIIKKKNDKQAGKVSMRDVLQNDNGFVNGYLNKFHRRTGTW